MTSSSVRSVCPYCGVGCGIVLSISDNRVTKVSGDKEHPANRGRLCTKGSTCGQAIAAPGRLASAFVRHDRQQPPTRIGIDDAIASTARRLRAIIDQHGPDAVALYVSGQMSLEAQYLANKLAKGYIRTRHIESNSRLCMASAGSGYKLSLGADGPPGSYDDFDHAEVFLVIGSNMADCHPILFLRLLDRLRNGARLIVVDPRRSATADKADLYLPIKPGTDLALLNGLLHLLVENGHIDPDFIARHTEGWEAMPAFLLAYTPARVAELTGLAEADIRQAAQWIGESGQWMSCWTMGLNQSTQGTWHTNALCNLHLATGAICRVGSGPFSLTGQPNAMGGREMGYMGPGLPGQRSNQVAADRAFVERLWQLPAGHLRNDSSDGTVGMFSAMAQGQIKACWIICTNPVASVANRQQVIDGLRAAELVITQDAYLDTETNRYADVLLPGALWAEAEGVMINSERNLTLMPKALDGPGESLPDWQIIARIACAMGYADGFSYRNAEQIFEEIKTASNPATGYELRGIGYADLRQGPRQWPCAEPGSAARQPIRYRNDGIHQPLLRKADGEVPALVFATANGRARFFARPHLPPAELPDATFAWVLNTGRVQHQWHTLTKTGRIAALNKLNPGPFVEINPQDALALGLGEGDQVQLRSRRGVAVLPARLTDRVQPGHCFAPFHWNDVFGEQWAINALTHDAVDPLSLQPAFKYTAVDLQRVGSARIEALELAPAQALEAYAGPALHWLLWASQTGNAERLAQDLAAQLRRDGVGVRVAGMDEVDVGQLREAASLLLVVSTFGDGEAPDNGAALWSALQQQADCSGLRYAVLALGDSSYEQFCGFGRRLDGHLHSLGAQRLLPRVDCEPDYGAPAGRWLHALRRLLVPVAAQAGAQPLGDLPNVLLAADEAPLNDTAPGLVGLERMSSGAATASLYNKARPYQARLLHNRLLSGPGAQKETRQIAFDLTDSGLHYQAGDALGVWPSNCLTLVEDLLATLRLDSRQAVTLHDQGEMPLALALHRHLDITRITAPWLRLVAERSGNARLATLLAADNSAQLAEWLWGRQLVDLLHECPIELPAEQLLGLLKPLQPRLYSISSSPKVTPHEVHLTVSTVRYRCNERARSGVCSGFLADRAEQARVPIFTQRSTHFRVPADPQAPMIMVGPGTGIAPFRAFLQERQALGATGRNWLLFGEQRQACDFYYRDELYAWQRDGHLQRLDTAFSRDQSAKVYVQQRMLEQGAQLWQWLEEGAHFYVCGDAARMAKDVDAALKQVIAQYGQMSAERAQAYVQAMSRERRYLRDVY